MRIHTSIPDDLFLQAEILAKRLGVSKSELFRNAVTAYIRAESASDGRSAVAVTELLDEVYSSEPSEVDGVLQAIQWASLPKEDW